MSAQEVNAIKQERNKGDGYGERLVDFYARFHTKLTDLGVSDEVATNYTVSRVKQIENGQFDKIEHTAQLEMKGIL
jgi:hypothetical protein